MIKDYIEDFFLKTFTFFLFLKYDTNFQKLTKIY